MRATLLTIFATTLCAGEPDPLLLLENGHCKRARDLAEAAFRAHPNDAQTAYLMARVRHELGNIDEAVKYAEIAVKLDPKSSQYHRELGEALADQAGNVSFLKQLGFARRVRSEFDTALALAPKDPDNLFDQLQYYMEAPGVVGGDKRKAEQIANEMVSIDPARGYLALAFIARKQKEDSKLEGLYQKAVESNPRNSEVQIRLAAFYADAKRMNLPSAEKHARDAVEFFPDRVEGYRWLALTLVLEKRFDDAAKLLSRAEGAIPDDLSPFYYAARALLRDGTDMPKAESYLQKYISQTKEPEAGAPSLAAAHWSLGLAFEKEGRKSDARNEMETALRLKPDFEPAKKDLKRLK